MILHFAKDLYKGKSQVQAVYKGPFLVWKKGISPPTNVSGRYYYNTGSQKDQVILAWDIVTDAVAYKVYRMISETEIELVTTTQSGADYTVTFDRGDSWPDYVEFFMTSVFVDIDSYRSNIVPVKFSLGSYDVDIYYSEPDWRIYIEWQENPGIKYVYTSIANADGSSASPYRRTEGSANITEYMPPTNLGTFIRVKTYAMGYKPGDNSDIIYKTVDVTNTQKPTSDYTVHLAMEYDSILASWDIPKYTESQEIKVYDNQDNSLLETISVYSLNKYAIISKINYLGKTLYVKHYSYNAIGTSDGVKSNILTIPNTLNAPTISDMFFVCCREDTYSSTASAGFEWDIVEGATHYTGSMQLDNGTERSFDTSQQDSTYITVIDETSVRLTNCDFIANWYPARADVDKSEFLVTVKVKAVNNINGIVQSEEVMDSKVMTWEEDTECRYQQE